MVVNAGFVRYVLNGNMGRKVVDDDDLEALTAVAVVCAESIQVRVLISSIYMPLDNFALKLMGITLHRSGTTKVL